MSTPTRLRSSCAPCGGSSRSAAATAPSAGASTATPRTRTGGSRCSSSSPGSSTSASTSASPPTTASSSRLPLASTAAGRDRAYGTTSRGGRPSSCAGTAARRSSGGGTRDHAAGARDGVGDPVRAAILTIGAREPRGSRARNQGARRASGADGGRMTGAPAGRAVQLEGAAAALAAAALFGVSAPLAKMLLPGTGPLPLAAFLYLGAGLGLTGVCALARARAGPGSVSREARLRPDDLPLLAVVLAAGRVAGPALLPLGFGRLSAVAGSVLLNLEAPLTILLAVALFGEHLGRRGAVAAVLIALGATLLGYLPGEAVRADWRGVAAIVAACLFWAIDNNATQPLAARDPVAVARVPRLRARAPTLPLALGPGLAMPPAPRLLPARAPRPVAPGPRAARAGRALRTLAAAP